MLNFCDFIRDYVFSTNHHLKSLRHDKVFNYSFNWAKPATFFVVYTVTNHPFTKDTICRCRST